MLEINLHNMFRKELVHLHCLLTHRLTTYVLITCCLVDYVPESKL